MSRTETSRADLNEPRDADAHIRRSRSRNSEVLARVVLLLHGRRIDIDSLTAGRVGNSDLLRIEVAVEADQNQARLIEAKLHQLADVLLVDRNDPDEPTAVRGTRDGHRES